MTLSQNGADGTQSMSYSFPDVDELKKELCQIWRRPVGEPQVNKDRAAEPQECFGVYIEEPKSSWSFTMATSFRKSISSLDKKLQGRVLMSLSELSEAPMTVRGDTVKPFERDKKGYWRYRIGDYRIIYGLSKENRMITLQEFDARGTAY